MRILLTTPQRSGHPGDHHALLAAQSFGSRAYESVPSQAMRATLNLVNYLKGGKDVIQANKW